MTIEEMFADYRDNVLPAEASTIQVQECRRAFYAGAVSVVAALLDIPDDASDADHERIVGTWMTELQAFGAAGGMLVKVDAGLDDKVDP